MATPLTRVPSRGTDGGFTNRSVLHRVPLILRSTLSHNRFSEETNARIIGLAESLEKGGEIPRSLRCSRLDPSSPWPGYEDEAHVEEQTWLSLPFFFLENFVYQLLLEIIGYRKPEDDPFEEQKKELIRSALPSAKALAASAVQSVSTEEPVFPISGDLKIAFQNFIYHCLWGNAQDLSISGGEMDEIGPLAVNRDRVIIDCSEDLFRFWNAPKAVGIILDNSGFELFADLVLCDFLLRRGLATRILLFAKKRPVFVSDAMPKDIDASISALRNMPDPNCVALSERLATLLVDGSLAICEDAFFNSPLFYDRLTGDLRQRMSQLDVVFVKGDANYRRLVSDLRGLETVPFSEAVADFPANLVAIRTLKSEPFAELTLVTTEGDFSRDSHNRVSGEFGVVQINIVGE